MKEYLSWVGAIALCFMTGYLSGYRSAEDRQSLELADLRNRIETADLLSKTNTDQLEVKRREDVAAIQSAPDDTGCADAFAPNDIFERVR